MKRPGNTTGRRTLDAIAADPRVWDIHSEGTDGYFLGLAEGWIFESEGTSSLHGATVAELLKEWRLYQDEIVQEEAS